MERSILELTKETVLNHRDSEAPRNSIVPILSGDVFCWNSFPGADAVGKKRPDEVTQPFQQVGVPWFLQTRPGMNVARKNESHRPNTPLGRRRMGRTGTHGTNSKWNYRHSIVAINMR
jgi:hypothetical protein